MQRLLDVRFSIEGGTITLLSTSLLEVKGILILTSLEVKEIVILAYLEVK